MLFEPIDDLNLLKIFKIKKLDFFSTDEIDNVQKLAASLILFANFLTYFNTNKTISVKIVVVSLYLI
ncbi:MAG: hypothetical protein OHK0038_10650 [Flammeovirgaceae bacterium]